MDSNIKRTGVLFVPFRVFKVVLVPRRVFSLKRVHMGSFCDTC